LYAIRNVNANQDGFELNGVYEVLAYTEGKVKVKQSLYRPGVAQRFPGS
jgi:hypothetical protein